MAEGVLFCLFWASLPILWRQMLKGVGVSLLRISIPGVFIAVMYIFQYLGLPLAFFELENISQNHIRDGRETVWEVFLYISITFSMLIIGFWWASAIQKKQKQNLEECLNLRKFTAASNVERMYIVLLSVLAIYVLLDYCLIIGLDNIAFFNLFRDSAAGYTTDKLRSLMGTEFTGKYHWYSYFMRDLLSWMLFAAYADYLIDPSRWRKIVYTSLLLTASFSMLMTTEKGPFLWLLVGIFFVRIIIQNRAISDFFVIIRGGLVFIPLTVALFYIFMETDELSVVLNAFVSRLFVGQIQSFFHAVEIVPEEINYLYGLTFSNPGGILPYTPYDLSAEMAYRYGLQASMYEAAITTLPLMFSAEAYVNFGLIGLILTSLFVGYFFYWSNIKFNGLIARPLVVGAYVWAILHFKDLSMTGITMLIVDHQLWLTLIFLSLGMLFIGNYSSKKMIPHIN